MQKFLGQWMAPAARFFSKNRPPEHSMPPREKNRDFLINKKIIFYNFFIKKKIFFIFFFQ